MYPKLIKKLAEGSNMALFDYNFKILEFKQHYNRAQVELFVYMGDYIQRLLLHVYNSSGTPVFDILENNTTYSTPLIEDPYLTLSQDMIEIWTPSAYPEQTLGDLVITHINFPEDFSPDTGMYVQYLNNKFNILNEFNTQIIGDINSIPVGTNQVCEMSVKDINNTVYRFRTNNIEVSPILGIKFYIIENIENNIENFQTINPYTDKVRKFTLFNVKVYTKTNINFSYDIKYI